MGVRGIRGAITVEHNEENEILSATTELLHRIVLENGIVPEEIASVFITVTPDLTATFPAKTIRQMKDWELVPLMCSLEIPVEGALPKCIRFMVMVNTEKKQDEIVHVYLREAMRLRPDLTKS
ncbi:chorismate mutase [Paenibacillus mucilaginosus]|uniref:chorismate mutase n=3 Tax=Paenibacillus mucilaginosus TaxID=61624 RepID=H6NAH5_9BACL|nr:chorismate mutase [Paenibacillus mucilaginosus]AEI41350.1 chorismate mutase [Paenibacillus mucilaginosus KNP414]AFC29900.1 chorismate mutase [Paenibacillus mucilaginosus 3016]AFH62085.1 chorismate mutase [Paenibacillus mucilaginosus K02]MCG7211229.1 chorismate mutase [Paenibacillus mucilaginosus]WDM30377.1 chorismate mutase [Paenibacillus mucilaginosus]